MSNRLDEDSLRFQAEVDRIVQKWAAGDEREYWRRWKQLGSWSMNKTQGDVMKKSALKKELMQATGGRCIDCGGMYEAPSLQMHRLDQSLAHDRARNFGYFRENVVLICPSCHERRESSRRE